MNIFLQTRIYMRTKKARIYALQTSIKTTIKREEQGKRGRWKAIKMRECKTRNIEFIE